MASWSPCWIPAVVTLMGHNVGMTIKMMVTVMSEYKEKISAYLDDAIEDGELRALASETNETVAARYQLIGEALRGEVSDVALNDVSAQVREALSNEHIESVATSNARQRNTESLGSAWNFADWLRPLSGLAVAASVAVVTVVLVTQEETAPVTETQVANTGSVISTPVSSTSAPSALVNGQSTELATAASDTTEAVRPVVDLRSYLAEHSEFAAQDTVQGRMPYARAVSYESE